MNFFPFLAQALDTSINSPGLSFGWLFAKTVLAMVIVVGLAFWFLKYIFPRLYGRHFQPSSRIKVVERLGLEARKALYVVQVGKKSILVGVTDHHISKLMDLEKDD